MYRPWGQDQPACLSYVLDASCSRNFRPFRVPSNSHIILAVSELSYSFVIDNAKQLSSLDCMILVTKEYINLLKRNPSRFRNKKVNVECQHNIHGHEKEQALESSVLQEDWEELLENGIGDILHLGAHANSLRADIHGEDLRSPDPGCRAPGRFVEENEQEETEDNGYADRLALRASWPVGCEDTYQRDHEHCNGHANGADEEKPSSTKTVCGPDCIQSKDDAKCSIQSVDEIDGIGRRPHLFVDGCAVGV